MDLIETYLSEVGRYLPGKGRTDIQAEIRSALQDLLDERARQSGRAADDEELILQVLKEYGDPEKVARSYRGEQYLIGPRLYPVFEKVLFIVLPIVIILSLVGLAFSLTSLHIEARDLGSVIGMTIGDLISAVITTVGSIALIFAILERFVPEFKQKPEEKAWDPRSLYKISPPDRVKPVELIVEILLIGLGILVFNFFPEWINIGYYSNGSWWIGVISSTTGQAWERSLLSEAFFRYLPALNILWGLTIALNIGLIQRGRWEVWSRWSFVVLKASLIVIAAIMLSGPSLISVTAESLVAAGFPADEEAVRTLVLLMNQAVRLALALTILFSGLDLVRALIHLFKSRRAPIAVT